MSMKNTNFKQNINTSNIKWTTKNIFYKRSQRNSKTWWKKSLQPFLFCNVMKKRPQGMRSCGKRGLQRHKGHNTQEFNFQGSHFLFLNIFAHLDLRFLHCPKRYLILRLQVFIHQRSSLMILLIIKNWMNQQFVLTSGQMTTCNVKGFIYSANQTENYHLTLQLPQLQTRIFSLILKFYGNLLFHFSLF